jgi:hypothetical protein
VDALGLIFSLILVTALFIMFRQMERWLHQHIFKVGWLMTRNYQTTTILYYTFFLPGVILHEVIYWLVAGILNVRAEMTITWPEKQEIGELKLNFVKLSNRVETYKKNIISLAPLIVGLLLIWHIANNVFRINDIMQTMSSGAISAVGAGISQLTSTPDFWLWFYLLFTISNTMFPTLGKEIQGWKSVAGVVAIITIAMGIIGLTNVAIANVAIPIGQFLGVLQEILLLLIIANILMVLILGLIEYIIENITGHSATFRKGKMITMTRAEALAERAIDDERERKRLSAKPQRNEAADGGVPSIYKLSFPVPGAPSKDANLQPKLILGGITEKAIPTAPIEQQKETPIASETQPLMPKFGGASAYRNPESTPKTETTKPVASIAPTLSKPDQPTLFSGDKPTESSEKPKPNFPTPVAFNKPAPLVDDTEDEDDDDNQLTKPVASVGVSPFNRPATPSPFNKPSTPAKPVVVDEEDEEDEAPAKPASSFGTSPFNRPSSPSPFNKPTPAKPVDDEEDEEDEAPAKPASSFGTSPFNRPATPSTFNKPTTPAKPVVDDDEDEEDEAPAKPASSFGTSPFNRPASPSPFNKPAPAKPVDDDEDEEDEAPAKPASSFGTSPFNRPASPSPFNKPAPAKPVDDDEDEPLMKSATPKNPAFGSFNKPATSSFGQPKPAPKPAFSVDDDDALDKLMGKDDDDDDLRYERDDEFYDEDSEEFYSEEDDE